MADFVDGHFHDQITFGNRAEGKSAVAKFIYNMRLDRWAEKHDGPLAFSESGNMPSWAADDPRKFWEAVDEHERANGSLYFNAEFALPLDLATREQQLAVARDHVRQLLGDKHPYTLTMHDNQGNPHCDVMWSMRTLDGIERDSELFFKRADKKIPARGGCAKVPMLQRGSEWIIQSRKLWEDVANAHLEAAGSNVRIDHRSYKERGIEKAPGVHLGSGAHRLEKAGISTWRGNKNRGAQHLNASLQEVQSKIKPKEKPNEQHHGRNGKPRQHTTCQHRSGTHAAPERAFTAWRDRAEDRPGLRASRRAGPERMPTLRQQRAGDGLQETRNPVLQRTLSGHRDGNHRLHGAPGGLYAVEALDRRQLYKARILQQQYQQEIQTALAARLAYVDRQPDRIAITLKGGGGVTDHGDRLLTKAGRDQEILAALALAKTKNWKLIQITGSESFKARAYVEAIRAGLAVVGYEPSPELRAQLEKEKTMTDQAGAGGVMSLAPDLTSPQASSKQRWEDALRAAIEKVEERKKAARVSELFQIDQDRKALVRWLDVAQRRHIDDLLWDVAHHETEDKTKSAALAPFYQMRATEAEAIKREKEVQHQEQLQRELAAQQQADAIDDQLGKPGLTTEQEEALERQRRYYLALADGHDEEEAKERAAKKSDALRL